jgi:hypothetical protein
VTAAHDRYLRVLVALALIATVTYETFGWAWLTFFPAGGLLFAGGAAFLTSTVGRSGAAGPAVRSAVRRLLLPFWLFAAAALPVMVGLGWRWSEDLGSAPLDAGTAWLWLLPISDPPVSTPALPWTTMLWFVRTLLWFLVLTPALLWIGRRWPLRLAVLPVLAMALASVGLLNIEGRVHDVVVGLCVYACCWLLGFAYADGRLDRHRLVPVLVAGAAAVAAGVWCWRLQAEQYAAEGLTDVPLATLLVSTGTVLVLLRAQPAFRWLMRVRRTNALLRFLTDRVVTVVLWTGPAVVVTPVVLDAVGAYGVVADRWAPLLTVAAMWVLLLCVAVLLGWAERPLRLRRTKKRRYVFEGNVAGQPVQSSS